MFLCVSGRLDYSFAADMSMQVALAIVATQVMGNLVNAVRDDFLRGVIGLIFAGALLLFLLRPQVRTSFARNPSVDKYWQKSVIPVAREKSGEVFPRR